MRIKILPFGKLSEYIGTMNYELPASVTVAALKESLQHSFPALQTHSFTIAVNREINYTGIIPEQAEIALLPPYAGG